MLSWLSITLSLLFEILFEVELDGVAVGALDATVAPATAAQGDILIVAADLDLVTVGDNISIAVDTRIDDGLAAARAGGFHLLDGVGKLQQAT